MRNFSIKYILIIVVFFSSTIIFAQTEKNNFSIEIPNIVVQDISTEIIFTLNNDSLLNKSLEIFINDEKKTIHFANKKEVFKYTFTKKSQIKITSKSHIYKQTINPIPLWLSIFPPLIAIFIALIFKEVFIALFSGVLFGTSIIFYYQEQSIFIGIFKGLFATVDTYIINAINNSDHISIIVFSILIGGMVNIITKNGGMQGVVNFLSKYAKSAKSGQFITWLLGIVIFFDDYANTLVVGNTMRNITDKLKISREKLSYIVDSTAAPIASIAFVTTWIGAELSYIKDGISNLDINESPYTIFISSLQYSFYPIFTIIFILFLIYKSVDFGPMYKAEKAARLKDDFVNLDNENNYNSTNWYNAAIPVAIIVFGTLIGLIYSGSKVVGFNSSISKIIGASDSFKSLLWSSLLAVIVAIALTVFQKILSLKDTVESMLDGFKTMVTAISILILAWSIALITEDLHTANFVSQIFTDINISPFLVPTITFLVAALISFSTGSSWGTMAILYPLILPTTWFICKENALPYDESISIFYNVISTVLTGSVLGDHCSPISDTTILSSLSSSCNHIQHVKTQMPYALTVGTVAIFVGTLPASNGVSSYILIPLGLGVLYFIVHIFGKKTI